MQWTPEIPSIFKDYKTEQIKNLFSEISDNIEDVDTEET